MLHVFILCCVVVCLLFNLRNNRGSMFISRVCTASAQCVDSWYSSTKKIQQVAERRRNVATGNGHKQSGSSENFSR